jgi:DNA repair protein RadC
MDAVTARVRRHGTGRDGKSRDVAPAPLILTAGDAARLIEPLFDGAKGERLAVLHLDRDRRLIALETHGVAGADEIELPIRAILAAALGHDAVGLVVAHNHPSGDPRPSRADKAATRRLAETAASLGITLHDHLIFAGGECRSLRNLGLL